MVKKLATSLKAYSALVFGLVIYLAQLPQAFAESSLDLSTAISSPVRPEADKGRDEARKPEQVLEFLGIGPGMMVMDVMGGDGYYTEMLAAAVGPEGKVVAQNFAWMLQMFGGNRATTLKDRVARYGNVEILLYDFAPARPPAKLFNSSNPADLPLDLGPHFTDPSPYWGKMDAAFTGLNLHDMYIFGGEESARLFLANTYKALKPGGVFGLTDHRGIDEYDNNSLHRITDEMARQFITEAGFTIEAESDLLHNPLDDHSLFMGHPSLKRNTDRMLIRARKPL